MEKLADVDAWREVFVHAGSALGAKVSGLSPQLGQTAGGKPALLTRRAVRWLFGFFIGLRFLWFKRRVCSRCLRRHIANSGA